MDWNCTQTEERLSDFIDRLMPADETAAFSGHLAGCADCTRLYGRVSGLVNRMQAVEPVAEPKHLVGKILDETLGTWRERKFGWVRGLLAPRFAIGAVTVAVLLVIVFRTVGVTPGKIKRADLSPITMARTANRQIHLAYARSAKFVNDLRVVYEIQSALQRTQDQSPSIAPPPAPSNERESAPPSSNPQEKSQAEPRPRSQVHSGAMVACIVVGNLPGSAR
jgi:hypothetical protein